METNEILKIGIIGVFAIAIIMAAVVWGSNLGLFGSNINSIQLSSQTQPADSSGTCGVSGSGRGCGGTNSSGKEIVQTANLQAQTDITIGTGSEFQEINLTVDSGWLPSSFVVKTGVPVKWNVYLKKFGGCIKGLIVPELGINYPFQNIGETKTFEFTPTKAGTIYFSCLMNMARGQIIVRDDITVASVATINAAAANGPAPKKSGCGCGG